MNDDKSEQDREIWNSTNGPLARLVRVDERTLDMQGRMEKIDARLGTLDMKLDTFIKQHNENCPAKVHMMLFRIIGVFLTLCGAGIITLLVTVFAKSS
jgi:hypothetical protein